MGSKFRELIAYLIFDRNWTWLGMFISTLCDIEMNIYLLQDKEFYESLQTADVVINAQHETTASKTIPHDTLYCNGCEYASYSRIAEFFYGYQCSGFCYYLNNGDYRFNRPTQLLWDGCKECCRYEDIQIEDME